MKVIAKKVDQEDHRLVEFEQGDRLFYVDSYPKFELQLKNGETAYTSKINYPQIAGAIFLGGLGDEYLWCIDPRWVAAAIKAVKNEADVQVVPFKDEYAAKQYIQQNAKLIEDFASLSREETWEML